MHCSAVVPGFGERAGARLRTQEQGAQRAQGGQEAAQPPRVQGVQLLLLVFLTRSMCQRPSAFGTNKRRTAEAWLRTHQALGAQAQRGGSNEDGPLLLLAE